MLGEIALESVHGNLHFDENKISFLKICSFLGFGQTTFCGWNLSYSTASKATSVKTTCVIS